MLVFFCLARKHLRFHSLLLFSSSTMGFIASLWNSSKFSTDGALCHSSLWSSFIYIVMAIMLISAKKFSVSHWIKTNWVWYFLAAILMGRFSNEYWSGFFLKNFFHPHFDALLFSGPNQTNIWRTARIPRLGQQDI